MPNANTGFLSAGQPFVPTDWSKVSITGNIKTGTEDRTDDESAEPPDPLIASIQAVIDSATGDLARLAEDAERAIAIAERAVRDRDVARVTIAWLGDKLASIQPAADPA